MPLPRFPRFLPLALLVAAACSPAAARAAESAAPVRHSQVGVCTHLEKWKQNEIPRLIAEAGIAWIRDDFYWGRMEREKGRYALTPEYVQNLAAAKAAGLQVIAIFNGGNRIYENPYDPEAYARAAAWFARETDGLVHAIEVLNEPANFGYTKHYGGHWNGVDKAGDVDPWVGHYVHLLNTAAKAIKAANPRVKVIGLGSVAPVNFRQIAMGVAREVDGITEHPYSFRLPPEYVPFAASEGILRRDGIATADAQGTFASQMRMYDELLKKHDGPREKWLTEWGWPTHQEAKAGGLYAGFTESAQAKYILRRLTETLGLGTAVTIIYDFRDDGTNRYDAEDNFGLVRTDLSPKPSYHAVKRFTGHMFKFRPATVVNELNVFPVYTRTDRQPIIWDGSKIQGAGQIMTYQFSDPKGTPRIAIWACERADGDLNPILAEVEIVSSKPVKSIERHDLMTGQSSDVKFKAEGGRLTIARMTIPDYPVTLTLTH